MPDGRGTWPQGPEVQGTTTKWTNENDRVDSATGNNRHINLHTISPWLRCGLGVRVGPFSPASLQFSAHVARVRPRTRQASHAFRESPFAWKRRHKPIFHIGDTLFRWAACIKEDLNVVECPTMAERCRDRDGLRTVPSLRHGTLIWLTPVAHSLISRVWRPTSIISPSGVCVLI